MVDYELQHHGIKGQKWGIRRFRKKDGTLTFAGKKRYSEDYVRANTLRKKNIKQLSNAELKELNNRMQLENQYKTLKKQRTSAGKKFVKDVAYDTSKSIASEYTKKYAKEGAKYMVSMMRNNDD